MLLLLIVGNGGSKQYWWKPRLQAPSHKMMSLSNSASWDLHLAQKICIQNSNSSKIQWCRGNKPIEHDLGSRKQLENFHQHTELNLNVQQHQEENTELNYIGNKLQSFLRSQTLKLHLHVICGFNPRFVFEMVTLREFHKKHPTFNSKTRHTCSHWQIPLRDRHGPPHQRHFREASLLTPTLPVHESHLESPTSNAESAPPLAAALAPAWSSPGFTNQSHPIAMSTRHLGCRELEIWKGN